MSVSRVRENLMHGLTGGGWKRSAGHGRSESCPGETPGRGAETYRRAAPPRQPPTLLRFGNSTARFEKIRSYARMRLALFISKRHRRSRAFGRWVVAFASPNQLGLVTLSGIVVDPRPFRDWRARAECRR
jgi:hypothetical protein